MKKSKARLREKLRNKPKASRTGKTAKRKKQTAAPKTLGEDLYRPLAPADDQGMEVMSQVILDFAAPLLQTCNDETSERKAISLAIHVWNTAMLPEPECHEILTAYLAECQKVMPPEELKTLTDYLDQLVQARRTRFAHNRKKITNCTFGDFGADRHIEVGYTME